MALGLGLVEGAVLAAIIVGSGVAIRHYRSGGTVSVEADEGGIDFDATSDGDDEESDGNPVNLSADGEADVSGALGSGTSEDEEPGDPNLTTIEGVGEARSATLQEAGFLYVEDVAEATVEELTAIDGIGQARAENLQQAAATAAGE